MRVDIVQEGASLAPWNIHPGALEPIAERLPVLLHNHWFEAIGHATDFQRSDEGVLSFDIELLSGYGPIELYDTSFYVTNLTRIFDEETKRYHILGGKIQYINLIPLPGFPKGVKPV